MSEDETHEPLDPMERDALTFWGDAVAAQIRSFDNGAYLVFAFGEPHERGPEMMIGTDDALRLHALLNEAVNRRVLTAP